MNKILIEGATYQIGLEFVLLYALIDILFGLIDRCITYLFNGIYLRTNL